METDDIRTEKRKNIRKWIAGLLCIALLWGFVGYGSFRVCHSGNYDPAVFGHTYSKELNIYDRLFASYFSYPSYAVTDNGLLYIWCFPGAYQVGRLFPLQLTEENFDQIISGASWTANTNAQSLREHNAKAWKCEDLTGSTFYLLLQNNGNVLLASGGRNTIGCICQIGEIGDEDVFFDYHTD